MVEGGIEDVAQDQPLGGGGNGVIHGAVDVRQDQPLVNLTQDQPVAQDQPLAQNQD